MKTEEIKIGEKGDWRDAVGYPYGSLKRINGKLYRAVVGTRKVAVDEWTTCPRWNLVKGKEARKLAIGGIEL